MFRDLQKLALVWLIRIRPFDLQNQIKGIRKRRLENIKTERRLQKNLFNTK